MEGEAGDPIGAACGQWGWRASVPASRNVFNGSRGRSPSMCRERRASALHREIYILQDTRLEFYGVLK